MKIVLCIAAIAVLLPGCSMLSLNAGDTGIAIGISRGQNPLPP